MHFKRLTILGSALLGLLIISFSIFFGFEYLVGHNQWIGLVLGIAMMIVGILIYQLGKKRTLFYWIAFIFNMIGIGLSITSYYVLKAYELGFVDFITAILVSVSLLAIFGLLTMISAIRKHQKIYISIIIVISFITSLILWLSVDSLSGLSFYYLNVIYFFMVGMISATDSFKDLSKEMAWVSFGAFILVSIIVLIILTEGEALSGFDMPSVGSGKPKRVKKRLV